MSFVSVSFAFLYILALALRVGLSRKGAPFLVGLLALSWIFYAWHVPQYIVLILFSTLVDYVAARILAVLPEERQRPRKFVLLASLVANLGVLGWFKYAGFLVGAVAEVAARLGFESYAPAAPGILLPIGISFYSFQSMSYTIDVYRGRIEADRSFLRVAAYVAFFPQLVAGPIVRAGDFLYQLDRRRRLRLTVFLEGGYLIIRGLFLKVVLADNLGRVVDAHWTAAAAEDAPHVLAVAVMIFFAGQLFCDFAGYSSIARGLAYQLGFRLPVNFDAPYLASSFYEFWGRWHITLSTWMRDYLYIPLGGNRGTRFRTYFNLILVLTISGLWHGASWTFIVWGATHGLAVALERALGLGRGRRPAWLGLLWYPVVQMTWILSMGMFRAASLDEGSRLVQHAFAAMTHLPAAWRALASSEDSVQLGWWFMVPIVALHLRTLASQRFGLRTAPWWEKSVYSGVMLMAILTLYTTAQEFIYFQF